MGPTPEPPAKRKRSRQRTEEALYRAAADLFAGRGYAGTTLDDIGRQAGIHKSTIFHYVQSKEDLLAIVLDRGLRGYLTRLEEIVADTKMSHHERLEAALRNHLRFVFEQRRELTVFLRERKHLGGSRGRQYLQMANRYEALFRQLVAGGIETGEFPPADARVSTLVLLGGANWMVEWYQEKGRLGREEIADQFVDLLVHRMIAGTTPHLGGSRGRL